MSRHRKIHNLPISEGGLEDGLFELQPDTAEGPNDTGGLKCDECPSEQFLDLEELSEHRRSAHNLVPCDLCPKFYGRTSHLWKHVYKIHKSHPEITCNICLKTSASKAHLAKHYTKHHREHAAPEENNYVTWQDVVNNPKEVHNCSKCNKVFRKDHLMKQHLKHCTGPRISSVVRGTSPTVISSFPCEKCSRVFETQSVLRKHMKSSHVMYTCEICDIAKDSRTELFDHIKADHTNHPELTCDVTSCKKMLRVKKDLIKHKREHRQGYPPPTCEFCGELLPNRFKLRKHLRSNHKDKTKFMCSVCTVSLLTFEDLQGHIKETHPSLIGKPNTCGICARKCPTKYKLESHLKTHGNEFFSCLTCFEVFKKEEEFNQHCEIHPPKKQNPSKSQEATIDSDDEIGNEDVCKRKLSSEGNQDATKMIRLAHKCISCKSSFATINELSKHQVENHNNLKCGICSTYHESEDSLFAHRNICTISERRIKRRSTTSLFDKSLERALKFESDDELCGTNLSSQNSIDENSSSSKEMWGSPTKHSSTPSRKVYENDNSYSPCELCDKSYPAKRALWQHLIRSHKTEAATTCGVCLKACGSYNNLDMHLVEIHPRNFEEEDSNSTCRVCGRYHNARSKLQVHAAIHLGEESRAAVLEYDCSYCNLTFNSRGFLTKHQKDEHNIIRDLENIKDEQIKDYPNHNLFGNNICSDDDDSQFEGFPVENCTTNEDSTSKRFESESVSQSEEFASQLSKSPPSNSTKVDSDIFIKSTDIKIETSVVGNSDEIKPSCVLDTSIKNSVCRGSFDGIVELFQQNNTSQQCSSGLEGEDVESVNSELVVNKDDSMLVYNLQDSVSCSSVINTVKSFQPVSGLTQCSRQSVSLEENNLQLSYTSETNRYITQNMTDTEIDNLVT